MKQIFKLAVAVLLTFNFTLSTVQAQAPQKMTYQAVVRNATNNLITSTQVGIKIDILQGSATGTPVYTETQTTTTNVNGLLTIEIGGQTGFDTINWANGPYFIETNIDPTGGSTYTITGVSQLLTVPYALHAKTAESITGGINETDPVFTAWDKSTGITITESQITNLSHLDSTDIATMGYVAGAHTVDTDTHLSETEVDNYVSNNGYLTTEVDGDTTNEIQNLSQVLTQNNDGGALQIKNIADPTNAQDAATKIYVDALKDIIFEDLLDAGLNGVVEDYDGNKYPTIKIGSQVWMAKDLKATHYPNGDPIPNVVDSIAWGNLLDNNTEDAYCFYNNDSTTDYGALYTFSAAIGDNWTRDNTANQGVCPDGWHLPTDSEWTILIDYLGGDTIAGGKMKEIGTTHWNSPNTGADNSSGFSGLPGGKRNNYNGKFEYLGSYTFWWSATEANSSRAYRRIPACFNTLIARNYVHMSLGSSVRCVRD